jgi:hypothetical protein
VSYATHLAQTAPAPRLAFKEMAESFGIQSGSARSKKSGQAQAGTHIAQYLNMALLVSWGDAALNICPVSENKGVTSPAIAQVGETPIEPLIL